MDNVLVAFLITLFAGLATGIGSCIAFFVKKTNKKFLSISLGFSAGVMIYVSMVEIMSEAKRALVAEIGEKNGSLITVLSFFLGMLLIALIDKLVPSFENPHEVRNIENIENKSILNKDDINRDNKLLRMGVFTALVIGIHNFPEGLATFISALGDMKIAIPIAIAIAIHNIPEGISISVPIYYATGDKKKAFIYSFLSGMSEPLGALVGYIFLKNIFNDIIFGVVFAAVAGIMVFISLDELLPAAKEYGEHHLSIYGLISGMFVMAISLILFI
ncbi:zinc transporter ZupT [Clostridium septicum]|uniref:Zinc transporter ZupT n=1 Tax=Clostridium septicum TaxID=1504 RepID=A0A9N7JLZ8_CLOSE|nr:zinc transporter ZupT [Clostridium septicum]AYE35114.1 zinc transporter ZupT [Clostridium septicum]MDU1314212.1 zinc transporter ZupT [Clostridium septicum]QAS60505.1 zinc transporter ZupT [Clostridium septicum]UEC20235.1 zinc transporter ZupT [Clostridium septicum]USS01711.1 zinc transporter ZupT [Clostridium septicum]